MSFLRSIKHALLPHRGNAYRPHLLSKNSLAFFFAAVLVAEGFLVAGLYSANPSQLFLSAVAAAPQASSDSFSTTLQQFAQTMSNPLVATQVALLAIVLILTVLLVLNFVFHIHIQSRDILLPGLAIVGIALLLLVLNAWYAGLHGIA